MESRSKNRRYISPKVRNSVLVIILQSNKIEIENEILDGLKSASMRHILKNEKTYLKKYNIYSYVMGKNYHD